MSYKITYGTSRFDKHKTRKLPVRVFLCAAALMALLFSPVREAAQSLLIPRAQQESIKEAYIVFENSLEQGSGFGEAVTAFCARIIENAELPDEE